MFSGPHLQHCALFATRQKMGTNITLSLKSSMKQHHNKITKLLHLLTRKELQSSPRCLRSDGGLSRRRHHVTKISVAHPKMSRLSKLIMQYHAGACHVPFIGSARKHLWLSFTNWKDLYVNDALRRPCKNAAPQPNSEARRPLRQE